MVDRIEPDQTKELPQPCKYFNHNWEIYQKILHHNYMEHREIYSVLHEFLVHRVQKLFQLLDLGCGDASIIAPALIGTSIEAYYGVDLSRTAIALAVDNLAAIPCSKTLVEGDFTTSVPQLIKTRQRRFDLILASFSLHHLKLEQKDHLIGQLFQLLEPDGVLIFIDQVRQKTEDRTAYIDRHLKIVCQNWTALAPQEVASIETHVASSDFPETQNILQQLALKHGFSRIECLYQDRLKFAQLLCFYKQN